MKINEVSKLSGVSVRTLHYYDEINLLKPTKLENGYRIYTEDDLNKLQQILFYKFLNFKLKDIVKLLEGEKQNIERLEEQRQLILKEKYRYEKILEVIDKTIEDYKGERKMVMEEKFSGFKREEMAKYEQEAKEKYGEEVIEESKRRQQGQEDVVAEKFNNVFFKLAEYKKEGLEVSNEKVQQEVESLYNAMRKYAFDCTLEVFFLYRKRLCR